MSDRLKALREERAKIVDDMRALTDKAEAEKRDMTDEELSLHGDLYQKQEARRAQIEAEERQRDLDRDIARREVEAEATERRVRDGKGATEDDRAMVAWRKFLKGGIRAVTEEEQRALQAGSDTEGGYLTAPQQFIAQLLKGLDNAVFVRARGTTFQVAQAESLGVPTLDTDVDDFEWTTELATGSEDTAMRFGKRELRPHPMAKRIKISKLLMRRSIMPVEQIVSDRLSYKLGVTQEKAYLLGDGNKKPLGLFVASNDGIPTSRDVSTDNTSTAITFDGLINAKYSVKSQYWAKSSWLFHRDAVKNIVKLKDNDGQYIWRMSVRDGEPDVLLGRPMDVSEYAPNTFTTGLYVGLFGDLSYYWIADALDLQIQRLVELYAESNQDGMIARYEGDGMPVLAEAFARVKLA